MRRLLLQGAWLVLVGISLWMMIRAGAVSLRESDFVAFYDSAVELRTGVDPETATSPNLNPPTLSLVLLPLTYVPPLEAFGIWTLLGLAMVALTLWELRGLVRSWSWMLVGMIAMAPAFVAWTFGQVTWLLLYPITRAWRAQSPWRAGLWLAPAIALKPPVALIAMALPWRVTASAAGGATAITLTAMALTGWHSWLDWLSQAERVVWLRYYMNVSVWGAAARLLPAGPIASFPAWAVVACVVVSIAAWLVTRRASGSRRWLLAVWWMLTASPAGWIYYLPLGLGPMLATWRWTWPVRIAMALLALPFAIGVTMLAVPGYSLINPWIYSVAFILLWWSWGQSERNQLASPL